jgi:quercetin dioxygenase-like cupin family protein
VTDTVIPFLSRRRDRALIVSRLPHVIAAVVLLGDGLLRFRGESFPYTRLLAAAEVLTSTLVLGTFALAVRTILRNDENDHAAAESHGIDWIDLCLAGMFTIEAVAQHVETGHWSRPTVLLAATMLLLALAHGPLMAIARRRRGMTMTSKGLKIGRPFPAFSAEWAELKPIEVGEQWAVLQTIHGRERRIDLKDLGNEKQVRDAMREAEILRTAKRRFAPRTPLASASLRPPVLNASAVPSKPRSPRPPELIERPTVIQAAGNKPKTIEEYAGLVNSGHKAVSVARMVSPEGWVEPGQKPEFEEITVVLRGLLRVEHRGGAIEVRPGQAIVSYPGEWIRYSSPEPGGAEYVAICLPAFSPDTVHRDAE